ncbi:MAG: hypothetical protein ACRC28_00790 [Clostridium sp.]|uniref:hypothetical protein n=1 Tax=Clostridium sp. TaxID=1506 RepID=UPI003F2ABC29
MDKMLELLSNNVEIELQDLEELNWSMEYKEAIREDFILKILSIGKRKENLISEEKLKFLRSSVKIAKYLEINALDYGNCHKKFYEEVKYKNYDVIDSKESVNKEFIKNKLKEEIKLNGNIENHTVHYGNNISAKNYSDNVLMHGSRGHGFAAEMVNDLYDKCTGKDAKIVGNDFSKNGADRVVNGIEIQTKYCKTGSRCVGECFENGKFRYIGSDGKPMKIEVPKDKFDDAVKAMEERIKRGQVPGVTNPEDAKKIIKKGIFTYDRAKNVAKFGKIESIGYDAIKGIRVFGTTFGISSIISFAVAIWNGESKEDAAKQAFSAGIKIGGMSWATSIVTAQIGRTGIEQGLRPVTDYIVKSLDPNTTAKIANALRTMVDSSAKPIYGAAAANNLSKVLRGNIVTGTITTTMLSMVDINRLVKGEISGKQAFKNITKTGSGVVGGGVGTVGGAIIGTAICPGIGTAIGGIIGGVTSGMAATNILGKGLDMVIEDDSKKIMMLIEEGVSKISFDYVLSQKEVGELIENIASRNMEDVCRKAYATDITEKYIDSIIMEDALKVINKREFIKIEA